MLITVGLLFTEKKWKRLNDVHMFDNFNSLGIDYYRINPTLPLSQQKPIQVVFHKLIDQLEVEGEENQQIVRWVENSRKEYPELLFFDSIHNIKDFLRRTYSYEVCNQAIQNSHLESIFSIPDYFLLPKHENLKEALHNHHMTLPILVKPQWTIGSPESHIIDILLDESALPLCYDIDMVIQSYKDHNSIIYKAYAIQDTVFLEKRISLPNVDSCNNPIHKFQINREKKCPLTFSQDENHPTRNNEIIHDSESTTEFLTLDRVRKLIICIEEILEMDLLGVDFLIDSKDPSKVYCIDVNLFPSYTGFENVSEVMGKLLLKKCGFFLVSYRNSGIHSLPR